jgi:hypothetical protein
MNCRTIISTLALYFKNEILNEIEVYENKLIVNVQNEKFEITIV